MLSITIVIGSLAIFTLFSFVLYVVHAQATVAKIPVPARVSAALVHAPAASLCYKSRVRR